MFQYHSKAAPIEKLDDDVLKQVVDQINSKPLRKYKIPIESKGVVENELKSENYASASNFTNEGFRKGMENLVKQMMPSLMDMTIKTLQDDFDLGGLNSFFPY